MTLPTSRYFLGIGVEHILSFKQEWIRKEWGRYLDIVEIRPFAEGISICCSTQEVLELKSRGHFMNFLKVRESLDVFFDVRGWRDM